MDESTTGNTAKDNQPSAKKSPLFGSSQVMTGVQEAPSNQKAPAPATGKIVANTNQKKISSSMGRTSNPSTNSKNYKGKMLAEILLDKGLINQEQFKQIKSEAANKKIDEEDVIKSNNFVAEKELIKAKAASYGVPFIDLSSVDITPGVLSKLPFDTAKTHQAIVFKIDDHFAHVGMADPLDIQRVNYLQSTIGKNVKAYFASPGEIKNVLDTKYTGRMESEVTEAVEEVGEGVVQIEEGIKDISEVENTIANAPVARIVNMILEYAVKFKASDIHIEPREKKLAVRFRINGIMIERLQLPVKLIPSVVSRVKILSDLKIDEHRVPQDGRFQIKVGDKEIDLRVSIMPTVHGEKVVIRLLEKGKGLMKLEETGLRGSGYKIYKESLNATEGIILVTGPTGSGKTQTLASSLMIKNKPDVNIVTLEDPVEIKIDGVNQVQINSDVGLTFAKGLRAMLRQDPDIIMVGEIRDKETADLAIRASLTGHLVFATLHTNSAAGALPRLLDMEIEPYLLTSTVNVIVGQRLVRTICDKCKESYQASPEVVKTIHKIMAGLKGFDMYAYPRTTTNVAPAGQVSTLDANKVPPRELEKQQQVRSANQEILLYRGKGCSSCNNTGYSGRVGIFEVLKVSEKIAQLIMEHRSAGEIEKRAIEEGMVTMAQDGFIKVLEGKTTLEEVMRVQKK